MATPLLLSRYQAAPAKSLRGCNILKQPVALRVEFRAPTYRDPPLASPSCGEGFLDTIQQTTPDIYRRVSKLPTAPGARTAFFSPVTDHLYLAVPDRASQRPEIRVYQPQ